MFMVMMKSVVNFCFFLLFFVSNVVFVGILDPLSKLACARVLCACAPSAVVFLSRYFSLVTLGLVFHLSFPPALAGGTFRGGVPVLLLDIYRLTDTEGVSLGGFFGVR